MCARGGVCVAVEVLITVSENCFGVAAGSVFVDLCLCEYFMCVIECV